MPVGVNRDAYGFAVRPQHLQRYREYANIYKVLSFLFLWFYKSSFATLFAEKVYEERSNNIMTWKIHLYVNLKCLEEQIQIYAILHYMLVLPGIDIYRLWRGCCSMCNTCELCLQEEEEERSDRWKSFLDRQAESSQLVESKVTTEEDDKVLEVEAEEKEASEKGVDGHESSSEKPDSDCMPENVSKKEELLESEATKIHRVELWTEIRSSLRTIEDMMSVRVKKCVERNRKNVLKDEQISGSAKSLLNTDEAKSQKGACEEDSDDEFYDVERSDPSPDMPSADSVSASANGIVGDAAPLESSIPWKEELEVLVRGGVPMALRGEVFIICLR